MSDFVNLSDGYHLPESPFKADLEREFLSILESTAAQDDEYQRAVEDAMYLAVRKRMTQTPYHGDNTAYLTALVVNISEAQLEFIQIAYENSVSMDTFQRLKNSVLGLMTETSADE